MNTPHYILTEDMNFEWLGNFAKWEDACEFSEERDQQLGRSTLWIMKRQTAIGLLDRMKEALGL